MTSFKRWSGAGAIVLVALALIACPAATPKKTPVELGGMALASMSFPDFVAGTTPAQTVTITASHFKGTDLRYTASSTDENVATARAAGNVVTVTPIGVGTATVLVVAAATADDEEGTESLTFTVTVTAPETPPPADNNAPRLKAGKTLPHHTDLLYGGSRDVDLSEYFTDDEGDPITYAAESTNTDVVTTSVAGSMLTVTVVNHGDATIRVTATDSHNESRREAFDVTVINQAPTKTDENTHFGPYPIGHEQNFDLSDFFTDVEGDPLTYTAMSNNDMVAMVTGPGTGSMITIEAVAAGTAMISVIANDGANDSEPNVLTVTVAAAPPVPNVAPEVTGDGIADMSLEVGSAAVEIELSEHFSDSDSGPMELTYTVSGSGMYATTTLDGPTLLTVTAVAAGTETITVTASDGDLEVMDMFDVTVTNPAPPTSSGLPAQTLTTDADPVEITLSMYFSGATAYRVRSTDTGVVTVAEAGGVLTLTPVSHGSAIVSVTPSNAGGNGATELFNVTVQAMPKFKKDMSLDNLRVSLGGATDPVLSALEDLSGLFEDPDGDDTSLTYSTKTSDAKKVFVLKRTYAADGTTDNTTVPTSSDDRDKALVATGKDVNLYARAVGTATITVTVTDSDELEFMATFDVTVIATDNSPPTAVAASGEDGVITSFTGTTRLKLSDESKKAVDNKPINDYFADTNLGSTLGDMLTFSVEYSSGTADPTPTAVVTGGPVKVTVADADKVAAEDRVADVVVSPTMWDGDPHGSEDKFTVTVTPRKAGAAQRVLIIATDLAGAQNVRSFEVQVNNAPKAEGAQATNPLTLGEVTTYSDTTGVNALRVGGAAADVTLVADDAGYFSDADADTLTCNVVKRGDDIFASGYPTIGGNGTATVTLMLTAADNELAKKGTAYVDVSCTDGFERSPVATLTVSVAFDASIQ